MKLRLVLAALVAAFGGSIHAQQLPTRTGEFRPQAAATSKAAQVVRMRADGATTLRRVELARPSAAEVRKLVDLNRNGGSAIAAPGRPQYIGFGRDVPEASRKIALDTLTWTTVDGGSRVARIEVDSPGAAGVRVALRLPATGPDATVRFAASGAAAALASVPASAIAQATARFGEYWSPVIDGAGAVIEIEVPAGAKLEGTTLEVARLSHLVVSPSATKAQQAIVLKGIGESDSCNIDYQCAPTPQDDVTYHAADATGKLVFTVQGGGTASCSGTLLNDTASSGTPYLFSANHCFESAYAAASLQVGWFFDSASCNSLNVSSAYVVQHGGAALLGRSQDWDWALMRLNSAPPDGVWLSGWNSETVVAGSDVEIFHHPSGDLKKWSNGTSFAQQMVGFGTADGGDGLFTRVVWDYGTTEGGSSGGALRTFNGTSLDVRGGLLGGDALCSNPTGSDYFSQFGAMLPLVRQYLSPAQQDPSVVVSVEYYHRNLNHYFMTVNPDEIAGLDSGVIAGWERTGFRFLASPAPGAGLSPVCRFYRKPQYGDSHFFSADPAECARVAVDFATEWVYESAAIYYVALPNTTSGACPANTKPIYRFLNTAEINHRYTTEKTVALELSETPGWIAEGYGPGPVYPVMCSPVGI